VQGDYAGAAELFENSLAVFQELGDKFGSSRLLADLARVAQNRGDHSLARELYRESIQAGRAVQFRLVCALCLEGLAMLAADEGQPGRAARLYGAADGLREATGTPVEAADRAAHERAAAVSRAALGEEVFAAAWAEGRALPLDDAIALALEA
jgi:hypothetical protein